MYWFPRPPYLRYALAAGILVTAVWLDLRPAQTVAYPFARIDLTAGTEIEPGAVEWRDLPAGLMTVPDLDRPLIRSVTAGEPLRPSDFSSTAAAVPEGWWSLEVELPDGLVAGQPLRLVVLPVQGMEAPPPIPAQVVTAAGTGTGLINGPSTGLIAVPPDQAATAAVAVAEGRVTVLIGGVG